MMTSISDPRGHPGLKLCVHVSVMGYYRFINFHQNRRGSGIFLGDFTWNDPAVIVAIPWNTIPAILILVNYFFDIKVYIMVQRHTCKQVYNFCDQISQLLVNTYH